MRDGGEGNILDNKDAPLHLRQRKNKTSIKSSNSVSTDDKQTSIYDSSPSKLLFVIVNVC